MTRSVCSIVRRSSRHRETRAKVAELSFRAGPTTVAKRLARARRRRLLNLKQVSRRKRFRQPEIVFEPTSAVPRRSKKPKLNSRVPRPPSCNRRAAVRWRRARVTTPVAGLFFSTPRRKGEDEKKNKKINRLVVATQQRLVATLWF